MSQTIIFRDLPATFPEEDKYQRPSLAGSVAFHFLLIFALVVFPLMFPRTIEQWQLTMLLVSPPPPPPAALPPAIEIVAAARPAPKITPATTLDPGTLISPIIVPKDIARIVDEPIDIPAGVIVGVPGGMPGGIPTGVLSGILSSNARAEMAAPPPPPPPLPTVVTAPPPPAKPIRVGGNVQEPQVVKLVSPAYPPLARKARVTGMVVLEATLTAEGRVEEIRVVSGHPLLINAAIECVKQWIYEPTYLNGTPVSVILTAKVNFQHKDAF